MALLERGAADAEIIHGSGVCHGHLPDGDYSLAGPVFATPPWLAEQAIDDPTALLRYHNSILFCGRILSIFLLLRRRIEPGLLNRFLLLLVSGSMLATSLGDFYGEAFTLVTVGTGVLAVVTGGRAFRSAGWVAIVLGVVNTPASLIGLALLTGARAVWQPRLRVLAAAAAAGCLIALEIVLRDGGYVGNHGARTIMPYSGLPGFDLSDKALLGYYAIVFAWLAAPVARRLLHHGRLALGRWRHIASQSRI